MSNGDRSRAPSCKSSGCDGWCSNCIKYYKKRGNRGGNGRRNVGLVGEGLVTAAAMYGELTAPLPERHDTGKLADAQAGQHEKKDDVNDVAKARGRNSNTGANRRPKGK